MKRLLGFSLAALVLAAAGCGNSVDAVPAPTPTPTNTVTPTPTGTPADRTGTYSISVTPPATVTCNGGALILTFNVPSVYIDVTAGTFTPDWNFTTGANFSLPDPEHGTITGDAFVANYTYCDYSLGVNLTTKHVVTWTGTYNPDGSFDSTLTQKLRNDSTNLTPSCGATETAPTVVTMIGDCSTTGVSWSIHGSPQ